ncbi:hypothetical protein BC826DRAFT_80643 [Russula brevipes]|nr:hypothetical protein BC826DRAFT_80643 [Russula brevipes]
MGAIIVEGRVTRRAPHTAFPRKPEDYLWSWSGHRSLLPYPLTPWAAAVLGFQQLRASILPAHFFSCGFRFSASRRGQDLYFATFYHLNSCGPSNLLSAVIRFELTRPKRSAPVKGLPLRPPEGDDLHCLAEEHQLCL